MENAISINLVRGRRPHFLDQFIAWALTIGRGLVIVTELTALIVFLMRFSLDQQLSDLHDKIVQEQNIVLFFKKNEDNFRNLQNRLSLAKTIVKTQTQSIALYQGILTLIPPTISLKSFTFSPTNIEIDANTHQVNDLNNFVTALKNYPGIQSVSLDNIENKTSAGTITAAISVTLIPTAKIPL